MEQRMISLRELGYYMGLSKSTIARLRKMNLAPLCFAKKVNRRVLIPMSAYEAWVSSTDGSSVNEVNVDYDNPSY